MDFCIASHITYNYLTEFARRDLTRTSFLKTQTSPSHHRCVRTLSDNSCVHVLWPTVHRSAFPEATF